jgi:hypothetical protein
MEVFVKKTLLIAVSTALLVSCASKRAAIVDPTIIEAETFLKLAEANNLAVPAEADSLVKEAKKQSGERQTERAFVLADEAVLKIHLSLLKQEQDVLVAENKKATDNLTTAEEFLSVYRNVLQERKNTPKEQVIH